MADNTPTGPAGNTILEEALSTSAARIESHNFEIELQNIKTKQVDICRNLGEVLRSLPIDKSEGARPRAEAVPGVDGAALILNVFTAEECSRIRKAIMHVHHCATEYRAVQSALSGRKTVPSHQAIRRNSQHHVPCHVAADALASVTARLAPFIPAKAGPGCKDKPAPSGSVSTFLRTYHYSQGQFSTPHYDRSFVEHERQAGQAGQAGLGRKGRVLRYSCYSVLIYPS